MWVRFATRLLAIGTLFASRLAAQPAAPRYYVARLVGSWVVVDSTGTHPLVALDAVAPNAALSVDPGARLDSTYEITLRDPRSLRVAPWPCRPVLQCRGSQRAAALTFESATLKTSARTGALFLSLGEETEQRSRVKLVGARGTARDWGIVVLAIDSGKLDLQPLLSRAGAREEDLVARICAASCRTDQTVGAGDCLLTREVPCLFSQSGDPPIPLRVDILGRVDSLVAESPTARAYGIATSSRDRTRLMKQVAAYMRDIDALGSSISDEERVALEEAAVRQMAHQAR